MKYAIKIEVGTTLPTYSFNYVAERYAAEMINNFPELEWCDVEVHEVGKPHGLHGYNRNPPTCGDFEKCGSVNNE